MCSKLVDGADIQGKISMVKHSRLAKSAKVSPLEGFDVYGTMELKILSYSGSPHFCIAVLNK